MKKILRPTLLIVLFLMLTSGFAAPEDIEQQPIALTHSIQTRVTFWTNHNGYSILTFWSQDSIPKKVLEFKINYMGQLDSAVAFDASIITQGRVSLRAQGMRDEAGVLTATHFHEIRLGSVKFIV